MSEGPSSPTSLLHLLASTGSQITFFSEAIVNEVKNGSESPLRVLIQLRAMERASKQILDGIKENILTEAAKYPGNSFELWGNKIEKSELGVKYDFSKCGDTVWERLQTDFETAEQRLKDRQEFLKKLKEPITLVDELTGEVVKVNPPDKTSTSGLKVTIR